MILCISVDLKAFFGREAGADSDDLGPDHNLG